MIQTLMSNSSSQKAFEFWKHLGMKLAPYGLELFSPWRWLSLAMVLPSHQLCWWLSCTYGAHGPRAPLATRLEQQPVALSGSEHCQHNVGLLAMRPVLFGLAHPNLFWGIEMEVEKQFFFKQTKPNNNKFAAETCTAWFNGSIGEIQPWLFSVSQSLSWAEGCKPYALKSRPNLNFKAMKRYGVWKRLQILHCWSTMQMLGTTQCHPWCCQMKHGANQIL